MTSCLVFCMSFKRSMIEYKVMQDRKHKKKLEIGTERDGATDFGLYNSIGK